MAMSLSTELQADCLHATVEGEFDLREAEELFLQILSAVEQYKSDKVLFDGQRVTGDLTTIQRFCYGEFVAKAVVAFVIRTGMQQPRFAYVLRPPVLDPLRFGEAVAANRGMQVKAFDNVPAARVWLGTVTSL